MLQIVFWAAIAPNWIAAYDSHSISPPLSVFVSLFARGHCHKIIHITVSTTVIKLTSHTQRLLYTDMHIHTYTQVDEVTEGTDSPERVTTHQQDSTHMYTHIDTL